MAVLDNIPVSNVISFALFLTAVLWVLNRLPATKGQIKRRLNAIRDPDVKHEAKARLLTVYEYQDSHQRITRQGLNKAVQDAEMIVRRDRKLDPQRNAQKRAIIGD